MNSKTIVPVVGGLLAVGVAAVVFSGSSKEADYEPTAVAAQEPVEVTVYKTPT